MINTYRPDLARSLSPAELLALRFDPTISREMVRNLAREGEAYLRQRGHEITAGRLYLCHFLGMEGAHLILSTPNSTMLVNVLGTSVIQANPFLSGKNAGYVVAWAERKMRGRGSWNVLQASSTRWRSGRHRRSSRNTSARSPASWIPCKACFETGRCTAMSERMASKL